MKSVPISGAQASSVSPGEAGHVSDSWTGTGTLPPHVLPRVIHPAAEGDSLAEWLRAEAPRLDDQLIDAGALLFRGFRCVSVADFEAAMQATERQPFVYTYRSTPRKDVSERVMSSTEDPPNRSIPLHNEMSYTRAWPAQLWFCCLQAAAGGGQTPLADSRAVWRRIPEPVRARFREHGVMYVRNYGKGLDLTWQDVFQTDRESEVEDYCRAADIAFEWRPEGRLRTTQVCQAETVHPVTGETVWFNQAHLFHISSLPPAGRDALLAMFAPDELPRNACFGNGDPIPDEMLDAVRAAYDAEAVAFDWQSGDVVLVDNILVAHGRRPYRGPRKVVVGMTV